MNSLQFFLLCEINHVYSFLKFHSFVYSTVHFTHSAFKGGGGVKGKYDTGFKTIKMIQ